MATNPPPRWLVQSWLVGALVDLVVGAQLLHPAGQRLLERQLAPLHQLLGSHGPLPVAPSEPLGILLGIGFGVCVLAMAVALASCWRQPAARAWFPPINGAARVLFAGAILIMMANHQLSRSFIALVAIDLGLGLLYLSPIVRRQ